MNELCGCGDDLMFSAGCQAMTSELGMTCQCGHYSDSLHGQPNESNDFKCDNNLNIAAHKSCADITQLWCVGASDTRPEADPGTPRKVKIRAAECALGRESLACCTH
ncbi:hypothetical protein E2C01_017962 [Portunus trituberculatus]|uniref:Uncharacterized protein n=1 Tax=Portunus trituberculatus TaxID=210409 RepID=A0A5B7DTV6_PORTR|nr:hypothetical protein [Portunus trituberculatus]